MAIVLGSEPKAIQIDAHSGSSAICVRRSVLTPSYMVHKMVGWWHVGELRLMISLLNFFLIVNN